MSEIEEFFKDYEESKKSKNKLILDFKFNEDVKSSYVNKIDIKIKKIKNKKPIKIIRIPTKIVNNKRNKNNNTLF